MLTEVLDNRISGSVTANRYDSELVERFQSWSRIASVVVIAVGVAVLIGWMFDITAFKNIHPDLVTMKANTALAFVLTGLSLLLLQQGQADRQKLLIARWSAVAVSLIGLLTLGEYVLGYDFGIDQLLFKEAVNAVATSTPGRMSPNTALNFLLVGLALRFLDTEIADGRRPAQYLALAALLGTMLALLGYVYDIRSLYGFASYTKVALHTVVTFLVLTLGILAARPSRGLMATITGIGAGGEMARSLLPVTIAIPVVIGWLAWKGARTGIYDTEFRLSVIVMLNILVFATLIWRNCRALEKTDMSRKHAEGTLREARDELEMRVQERTADLMESNQAAQTEIVERKRAEERSYRLMQEMHETVSVLASSTNDILSATTQLATTSAETAVAVTQTTTTVEEVKQTAQVSTEKAQHVSESAQKTAQISQHGRKSVQESVAAMQRIQAQMESTAESIVRLAQQNQTISEIIASVNDLAEQSKLLAVNAAIEAAKAGDQGKGFAVVAQEIKSLAEQSKQATAQVRAILGDIQKATSAAVMSTEQGSKAVAIGVKLSAQAGEAIQMLAESIEGAAQAATQIAVSAQQQLVGMDQVALAMRSIGQASLQNVSSTKQTEDAAKNLHELGLKLKQLAETHRV